MQWLLDPSSVDMVGDLRACLRQLVSDEAWQAARAARAHSQQTSAEAK